MSWVDPGVVVAGTPIIATWGNEVREALLALRAGATNRCDAYHNSTQDFSAGGGGALSLNSSARDTASMHSTVTNNERIKIPIGGDGDYLVIGFTRAAPLSGTPTAVLSIQKNGSSVRTGSADVGGGRPQTIQLGALCLTLVAGDYLNLAAAASSGDVRFGSATAAEASRLEVSGPHPAA